MQHRVLLEKSFPTPFFFSPPFKFIFVWIVRGTYPAVPHQLWKLWFTFLNPQVSPAHVRSVHFKLRKVVVMRTDRYPPSNMVMGPWNHSQHQTDKSIWEKSITPTPHSLSLLFQMWKCFLFMSADPPIINSVQQNKGTGLQEMLK